MAYLGIFSVVLFCQFLQTTVSQETSCSSGLSRCDWEPWSTWSSCSKTCGDGTRQRSRGLCCKQTETYDACLASCGIADASLETEPCGFVCPAGDCFFQRVNNTGVEATDYTALYGAVPNVQINPPLHLLAPEKFCERSCRDANLQNGLFCWTYSYSERDKCFLHFFNKPLSLTHPELAGQSPGSDIYVRNCTASVECQATVADIVFVVDSSGSIGIENFQRVKVFLQNLVNMLDIDYDLARVGMLVFNDQSRWEFKLGEINNKFDIFKAIQRIQYIVGGTMTADALAKVRTEGFLSNRTGVPMIAIVVTDGLSRYPPLTRYQASLLRKEGVQVYAVGVGNQTNEGEIFNMASVPEEKYMYQFSSFDTLDATNVTLDVNYVKCKEKLATTSPATLTTVANNCTDVESNCAGYGKDMCTDYRPWAMSHCALYCGFCTGIQTTPPPCVDKIPNCASYGQFYCQDKGFVGWVEENCRKFCGICTSAESTVTTVASTLPTTTAFICEDTIDNCEGYKNSCGDDQFRGYLMARCPATCGYCQSHQTVNQTTQNGLTCPEWSIPTECYMETVPGCCSIPRCPKSSYVYTAKRVH